VKAVPQLEQVDMVMDKTEKTVHSSIMEQKDRLLSLCNDMLEMVASGWKPIKALKNCFKKVGTFLLRMIKGAISAGVMVLQGLAGCLSCICGMFINAKEIVESIFAKIMKMVKGHLKKLLKKKAPGWLVEKLPWNWTPDTDIGDAVPEVEKKKERGEKTVKEKKGLPQFDAKAEKECAKPPKGVKMRAMAVAAAEGLETAGDVAVAAVAVHELHDLLKPDEDSDEEWDEDSEEENSDAYDDFDAEEGDASEPEEEVEEVPAPEEVEEAGGEAEEAAPEEAPQEEEEEAPEVEEDPEEEAPAEE